VRDRLEVEISARAGDPRPRASGVLIFMRMLAAFGCLVLGVALLSIPALLARTWHGWTLACTRSGFAAGTCHAEPTLRDDLGRGGFDPRTPRSSFLPLLPVDELAYVEVDPKEPDWIVVYTKHGHGAPSEGGNGFYRVPLDSLSFDPEIPPIPEPEQMRRAAETARVVRDWNAFIRDPSRDVFRLRAVNYARHDGRWVDGTARVAGVLALAAAVALLAGKRRRATSRPATAACS
jgi:hypothetical protein